MKCLVCGSEFGEGQKFCTQCGAMLPIPEETTVSNQEMPQESVTEVVQESVTEVVQEIPETVVVEEQAVAEEEVVAAEPMVEMPAEPVVEMPAEPVVEVAAEPAVEMPAEPVVEVAAEPAVEIPAQPVMAVPPVPVMPMATKIDPKELMPIRQNAWTSILKGIALFFYVLEMVAVLIIVVLQFMGTSIIDIPFMNGPTIALVFIAIAAILVLTLVFIITMCFLNMASDITKTRKHMRNIEYILRKK